MDTEKFLELLDTLIDFRAKLGHTLDFSFAFICAQCRKLHGECEENIDDYDTGECIKRFTEYG